MYSERKESRSYDMCVFVSSCPPSPPRPRPRRESQTARALQEHVFYAVTFLSQIHRSNNPLNTNKLPSHYTMATKKDMRREDLIVPYTEAAADKEGSSDFNSTMTSTLPMAAIFTRNKLLGWTAVLFAVQGWLSETEAQRAAASQPGYFSVGMSLLSLCVGYMPLFMPPVAGKVGGASGTEAPAAAPQ
ncbi:uncharacterized protein RCC_01020 [Ramularia collo-cygni]|uniref:Protein Asterix n=1 Tax=Ramularia collo-cygni TaxID=112498 RepID=A0A2D3UTH0_9PEZI|nr:uncharacterized protein RCC_01020 [Ramularia collo-cygni]CZT15127.1 uncharacterized protein RCC_01020 [Ramularia collo-cygni]